MGVCLLALKMFNKASLTVKSGQDPEGKPRRGRAMMENAHTRYLFNCAGAKSGPCVYGHVTRH